ncbi:MULTISPECIES: YciI family protein [unclassified Streptomyces]|uniref:YciI family protein n=1 Tax=unclassified Streptomyces TaxID=2593676 RepID=UPI003D911031
MQASEIAWLTRHVLLYVSPPDARAKVAEFFAAHNAYADAFRKRHPGALLMIGPFPEPEEAQPGAMSIFTSREAAEEFAASDPFVVNGVVGTWQVRTWLVSPEDQERGQ